MAMPQPYDVIIVGGGPAGLSAGIFASRTGLKTLILEADAESGGDVQAVNYENFPGFPEGITRKELIETMEKQASKFGAEIRHFEDVVKIEFSEQYKTVSTSRKTVYHSIALIISTGTQRRKLNVPGEAEYVGRGVSYCHVCDAPFFKDLLVAVVGFTNEALRNSLFLAEIAKKVILITEGETISEEWNSQLRAKGNIQLVQGNVRAILGSDVVEAVLIQNIKNSREFKVEVNGVFILLGKIPATEIVAEAGIGVDKNGCITVDRWQRTNIAGVFAAGDCTCGGMQVVTAVGEGAMAALKTLTYLKRREEMEKAKPKR